MYYKQSFVFLMYLNLLIQLYADLCFKNHDSLKILTLCAFKMTTNKLMVKSVEIDNKTKLKLYFSFFVPYVNLWRQIERKSLISKSIPCCEFFAIECEGAQLYLKLRFSIFKLDVLFYQRIQHSVFPCKQMDSA